MNNQYLQWITGKKRGEVESVELMQDGQTFEDLVLLSNGGKISMTKIGKDFIILPSTSNALSSLDLDMMYPLERPEKRNKPSIKKEHQEIMGIESASSPPVKKQQKSSFASDLLSRSKKTNINLAIDLNVEMPSYEFFDMINKTFDEQTINEVIDLIVESIKNEDVRLSIRNSINKFYEGNK